MKKSKKARQLPTRGGLNDLGKSERTINDYSKVSPINPSEPTPSVMQNLAKPKTRK